MGVNIYYLELIFILVSVFQQQKLMKKDILTETLFLRKKDKKTLERKLGCKFIRINTSNAKHGYDLDYEVANVQDLLMSLKTDNQKKKNQNETVNMFLLVGDKFMPEKHLKQPGFT